MAQEADGVTDKPEHVATATAIIDLIKAFERVQLRHVWNKGVKHGFPLKLLSIILTYFSYARRLVVDGCASDPMHTVAAIVAGSRFSVCFLRQVLQDPMDALLGQWMDLRLKVYVDDASMQLRRPQGRLRQDVPALLDDLHEELRTVDLDISKGTLFRPDGKSQIITSSPWLRERMCIPLKRRGYHTPDSAVYLGVDLAPSISKRHRERVRNSILKWRLQKLRTLGRGSSWKVKKGIRKVLKTGLIPAYAYGMQCLGMSDVRLKTLRKGLRAVGTRGRGSTTLHLALAKMEPTMLVSVAPIRRWACAIWDGTGDNELMLNSWFNPRINRDLTWNQVIGPATAVAMSLRRAQWK